jgi:hypothetical protein
MRSMQVRTQINFRKEFMCNLSYLKSTPENHLCPCAHWKVTAYLQENLNLKTTVYEKGAKYWA